MLNFLIATYIATVKHSWMPDPRKVYKTIFSYMNMSGRSENVQVYIYEHHETKFAWALFISQLVAMLLCIAVPLHLKRDKLKSSGCAGCGKFFAFLGMIGPLIAIYAISWSIPEVTGRMPSELHDLQVTTGRGFGMRDSLLGNAVRNMHLMMRRHEALIDGKVWYCKKEAAKVAPYLEGVYKAAAIGDCLFLLGVLCVVIPLFCCKSKAGNGDGEKNEEQEATAALAGDYDHYGSTEKAMDDGLTSSEEP